ncbi:MAG: ATP-binding protein [Methanobrevibacter sp.]|nr:ATP-binding protein [Candidatus Methanovirga procula]
MNVSTFKKHKFLEVDFKNGLNIITGINSTGKSTITQGLTYAFFGKSDYKLNVCCFEFSYHILFLKISAYSSQIIPPSQGQALL